MDLPLLTQLAHLDRTVRAVTGDANQMARTSSSALTPRSPGVRELFARADAATKLAKQTAASEGWDLLTREQQANGNRIVATAAHAARTATQLLGTGPQFHAEVTTSVTDPASPRSTELWNSIRAGRDLPNVRILGTLNRDALTGVANLLDQLPRRVIQQLDAQGCRSTLFSGKLTDVWGYRSLRGVQPRGWPAGKTWDVVPGVGGYRKMATDPSRDHKGQGHGTDSLALHELGHVIDGVFATAEHDVVTADPTWLAGPQAEVRADRRATDYVRNYPEEWFAEALVAYTMSRDSHARLEARYPRTAAYLAATLGAPRLP